MKWRYLIHLVFVSLIVLVSGCNCGDSVEEGEEIEVVRVNNGFASKDENGNLAIKRCDKNFADCNKDSNDGCEANITTDLNNCGRCGNVCGTAEGVSSVECISAKCKIEYCISGYIDLDGKYENGCEYRCQKFGDEEIPSNLRDDDCDGFVDNVCRYEVENKAYSIATDLTGKVSNLISTTYKGYMAVAFIESILDKGHILRVSLVDDTIKVIFLTDVKELPIDCRFGSVAVSLYEERIDIYWSENCKDGSKILYRSVSYNGLFYTEPVEFYKGYDFIDNLIFTEYKASNYLSFETIEKGKRAVFLGEIDLLKREMTSMRIISNRDVDSYGHNLVIENDKIYTSYCEIRDGKVEVVIMENGLLDGKKVRYPIYETSSSVIGTAIGYGGGYFVLIWTESKTSVGTMYITVLNSEMYSLILKKVDFLFDEFGLPVIIYNGNIFGSTFQAVRNNKGYILFADMDVSGKKISELIISPVSLIEKPYMSLIGKDYYVFYTDINTKMKYFLNMKRVLCNQDQR
ncbi:MAG: hypothetical protein N2746_07360 [Deltaproteobacteria bacterium]|nr:hypothetical protein [Deltaproteobacteria bacterium]